MEVFIVSGWRSYDGEDILHVASTQEKANEFYEKVRESDGSPRGRSYDGFDIAVWRVDENKLPDQG